VYKPVTSVRMCAAVTEEKTYRIEARERGPGPGRYRLPSTCGYEEHDYTKFSQPAYSFGNRLPDINSNCSPGPVYFIDPCVTRRGKDGTPSYSMLARQQDPANFNTPSAGAYSPEKVHPQGERHAPVFSMSTRTRLRKRDQNPAPNRYLLPKMLGSNQPNKSSYPSYSMSGRYKVGSYAEDLAQTPGPGQYNAIIPDRIRTQAPQYTLQGRSYMAGDNTKKPGPGAHRPEAVKINKPQPPIHSLGIRHSEFVAPLLISASM